MKLKNLDLKNQRFGRLLVVAAKASAKYNCSYWECICDCGNSAIFRGTELASGRVKSCGCYRRVPANKQADREEAIMKLLYRNMLSRSRRFWQESDVAFDTFKELSLMPCHYCGLANSNSQKDTITEFVLYFNGIDRLDSSIGYLKDNIVSCCKYCNMAKSTMQHDEFLAFIKRIATHNKLEACNV